MTPITPERTPASPTIFTALADGQRGSANPEQREQLFASYPRCEECQAEYLPIAEIDGCPWHTDTVEPPKRKWLSFEQKMSRLRHYDVCKECKVELKKRDAPRCRVCNTKKRTTTSDRCECGAPKDRRSAMCVACRYPDSQRGREFRARDNAIRATEPLSECA